MPSPRKQEWLGGGIGRHAALQMQSHEVAGSSPAPAAFFDNFLLVDKYPLF